MKYFKKILSNNRLKYVLLLILIIFIILLISYIQVESMTEEQNKDLSNYYIVCAKYQKNCDFLNDIPIPSIVLQKNIDGIPNIANEATTYLYYIIQNYDNMPKNVIFIHDENESWHHYGKITEEIYKWIKEYENQGSTYYEFNVDMNSESDYHYKNNTVFKDYYDTCLLQTIGPYETVEPKHGAKCCAQFIISRERILYRSKEFYEKIYKWLIDNTKGEGNGDENDMHSGYMTGRYLEWTWRFIFNGLPYTISHSKRP